MTAPPKVHVDRRSRGGHAVWRLWWIDPVTRHKRTREQRTWTRAEALRAAAALEAMMGPPGPALPWEEFMQRCLATHALHCRPSSTAVLRSVLRRYALVMGPQRLGDVTRETIYSYLAGQLGAGTVVGSAEDERTLGPVRGATANKHLTFLRHAFAWAIGDGALAWANPCSGVRRLKEIHLTRCVYEKRDQVDRLVAVVAEDGPEWETAVLLGFECGLRIDEIAHLTWRSVDLPARELMVQPEADGWAPKGRSGRLAITDRLAAVMGRLDRPLEVLAPGCEGGRVLGGDSPGAFARRFRACLRRACVQAGLPAITPHGLRRTFGTILANSGMQAPQLQMVMRHQDIRTTMRYYVRVDERRAAEDARRRIQEAL